MDKQIVRNCFQGNQNAYAGRHGKVVPVFKRVIEHTVGCVRWFECYLDSTLYILFMGTHNDEGWENNFDYQQIFVSLGGPMVGVHKGFWKDEYQTVANDILTITRSWLGDIVISGHSKGGALAQACAFHLGSLRRYYGSVPSANIKLVLEASPRFGDWNFVKEFSSLGIETEAYRYGTDPVTELPPLIVPGGVKKKFLCFDYTPAILYYGDVVHVKRIGVVWWKILLGWFIKVPMNPLDHEPYKYTEWSKKN